MSEGNDKLEIGVNIPEGDLAKLDRLDKSLDKLGDTATKAATALKTAAPAGVDFAHAFASPSTAKNLKAQEESFGSFIKSAAAYDSKVEQLGTSSKSSLGRMSEAMKSMEKTGIAGSFKHAQELMLKEIESGDKLSLNLVHMQTTALRSAYEHRLAVMGQLQGEELAAWRSQGVNLGGFQAAQLAEFKRVEGLKRQAEREALAARRRSMSDAERDMALNVKYATDTNTALQQISEKGSSTMLANIQKRSESIRRMLESGSADAEKLATKKYGSDFVGTVRQGIQGSGQVLAKHDETRIALISTMADKEAEAIRLAAKKVELARVEAAAKDAAVLDRAAARVMKASTLEGYKPAGPAWWESQLATQQEAAQRYEAGLLKEVAALEKTTARVMKASTMEGYKPAGAAWWEAQLAAQKAANIGNTGQRLGGSEVVGSYTPYNALRVAPLKPIAEALPALNLPSHAKEAEALAGSFEKLSLSGNNLHSSVRGLASGFGALWLTWGNTLPLLAGAAVSFSLMGAIKSGKEFETTLFGISEVAGTSAADMAMLRDRLLELGNKGMYGPLEAAKGLEVLSLAGLNATDAMAALEPTMRFASASGVSMQKAAEVTVAVGQAYGFTAKQYETLQDIIFKTASDTIASVSDMSEAFKTASVVAQHFNLSLADTAEGLGSLAQIGITGSAAGTSYRNFYTEITKTSGKVAEALKQLKVNIRQIGGEADGELKPTIEIFRELTLATINKTKASQDSYFAGLSNERGSKTFAAAQAKALETMKSMVPEHLKEAEALEAKGKKAEAAAVRVRAVNEAFDIMAAKSKESTENAAGKNFIISAEKRLTPQGSLDALKASLETGLVKAFGSVSDSLMVFADQLHQTFSSDSFQTGLANLVKGTVNVGLAFVDATKYAWEHKEAMLGVAGAYILFGQEALTALLTGFVAVRAATAAFMAEVAVGSTVMAALRSSLAGVAMSLELLAPGILAAGAALATGALVAGIAAVTLGVIAATAAVGALAVKWIFAGESAQEALEKQDAKTLKGLQESSAAIKAKMNLFNESLTSELAASESALKARKDGLTASQAADKAYGEAAVRRVDEYYRQLAGIERLLAAESELYFIRNSMYDPEMAHATAQAELESRLVKIRQQQATDVKKTTDDVEKLFKIKKQIAAFDLAESKTKRRGIQGSEEDIFDAKASKAKPHKVALDLTQDNTLTELTKRHTTALALFDKLESDKLAILKVKRDAEMITEGQYFAELLTMTRAFSDEKTALLEHDAQTYSDAYATSILNIVSATDKWKKSNPQATSEEVAKAVKDMETKISSAQNSAESFFEKISAEKAKAASATFRLIESEVIKVGKALHDLKKTSQEFWDAQDKAQVKAAAAAALDESLRYADPSYAAGVKASAAAQEALNDQYDKLVPNLKEAQANLDALIASQMDSGVPITAATELMEKYNAQIAALRSEMDKLKGEKAAGITQRAAETAKTILANSERDKLAGSLADAVIGGLTAGGEESAKNLKKVLEDELSKPIKVNMQAMFSSMMGGPAFSGTGFLSGLGGPGALGGLGGPGSTILASLSGLYDKLTGSMNVGASVGNFLMDKSASITSSLGLGEGANQLLGEFGAGMTNTATLQSATMAAQAGGAQLAGVIAGSVMNGVSGYGLSKALSGGFKIDGLNIDAIAGIASMIPGIGPVAGVIGGLVSRAFGHGETQVREQGTRGTFSSSGFSGQNYANMYQQGGWFTSDRTWTETSAIDAGIAKRWTTAFEGVKTAAADSAKAMGLSTDSITNYSKSIDLAAGATSDTVLAVFTGMADELALKLVPNIAGMALEGESARETLARLASGMSTVNNWLTATHHALFAVSISGAAAAAELIKAHGGLDKFIASSQAFYDTYYTSGEKVADSQTKMRKALALLGYALPSTNAGFRALVEGLDLNTEAGRTAHAVLLNLAPEFATTAEALKTLADEASKAAVTASEAILKAVTGSQRDVVQSLGLVTSSLTLLSSTAATPVVSSLAAATAASAAMSNELLFMNSIMGDSASSVLAFKAQIPPLTSGFTDSQQAAYRLQQQIYSLSIAADSANIDFTKLSAALASVNTETFMVTVTKVFEDLAGRIGKVLGDISSERIAVRDAAIGIIAPESMSKSQIESRIASVQSGAPSNSGVLSTAANFNTLTTQLAAANARITAAQAAADTAQANATRYTTATSNYGNAYFDYTNKYSAVAKAQDVVNATPSRAMRDVGDWWNRSSEAYTPQSYIDAVNALTSAQAALKDSEAKMYSAQALRNQIITELGGNGQGALTAANQNLVAETTTRDALQAQVTSAQAVAKAAVLAYQKAMQDFVNSASTSVTQLAKLKDETVKYYESQKALADLLAKSAAGIRETIRSYKFSQMTDVQKAEDLKSQFAQATLLAQSATGEGLAAAGDKVNSLINPLIEALQATGQDSLVSKVLADSESVAALVDKNILAMGDYKSESLALLDMIDKKLLALGASTGSAQDVIAAAVAAGSDKTASGLRAVIAAILGQSIPAFATGGFHTGGLRLVGENGPELEATGPSRIYNAAQTQSLLDGTGGSNTAQLEALIAQQAEIMRQQSRQLENMSYELRAIAGSTGYTSAVLKKVTQGGESLQTTEVPAT